MELQNFGSLFEIFATFTLAYIIIDELTENPFISLISEKILKKYQVIDDIQFSIKGSIEGQKTNLNNIAQFDISNKDIEDGLPKTWLILNAIEARFVQSFGEIRSRIRKNYATRVFVYLNSYLFLYCLTILYYAGLYEADGHHEHTLVHNLRLDHSLFLFNCFAVVFLIFGWFIDKPKEEEVADDENRWSKFFNGYVLALLGYLLAGLFGILAYYCNWNILPFQDELPHQVLTISCVLIPVSNFVIYIFKARQRANKCLPNIKALARSYKVDYENDLKKVQTFVSMCDYFNQGKVEIIEENSKNMS